MHSSEKIRPGHKHATGFDIAIIGAGASGVLLATHLLANPSPPKTIAMIGKAAAIGEGAAYSTKHAEHLLNVTSNRMSAFDDAPDDFVRFLSQRANGTFADLSAANQQSHFAERQVFAEYLRASLNRHASNSGLQTISDEAVDIEFADRGATISLATGRSIQARAVALAIGNFPRELPFLKGTIDDDIRIDNAWDYDVIAAIDPDENVAIIGSGLSMVDTALSLAYNQHRGRIHVISRHGLFPLSHALTSRRGKSANLLAGQSLETMLQSLRRAAGNETAAGNPWQFVMDDVRPHIQQIWLSLTHGEQQRFIRHLARYWDIHRHRIAPSVHAILEQMQSSGQIARWAGRVQSMRNIEAACEIRLITTTSGKQTSLRVNRVVNSVGLQLDLRRVENRLVSNLFARGLIRPGRHGIGLDTDQHGAVYSEDGQVNSNFYTLGSTRIGQLWESIAVPELRTQAQHLASRMLSMAIPGHLPGNMPT